jgi:hypothetical protein
MASPAGDAGTYFELPLAGHRPRTSMAVRSRLPRAETGDFRSYLRSKMASPSVPSWTRLLDSPSGDWNRSIEYALQRIVRVNPSVETGVDRPATSAQASH